MSKNRRDFIRESFMASFAGLSLPLHLPAKAGITGFSSDKPIDGNDEEFWRAIRQQFPLDKDFAYMNNGTMGPSPYPVIEATHKAMMDADQFGSYAGWETTAGKIAGFVKAGEDEIALTHNATEGINIMCWGLPLKRGDEVILTTHEHAGNALPWLNRQKLHGIVIRTFEPAPTADETLNRISSLINKKTRAIAVPHIPCTQGQVFPVKEISKLGKAKGLFVCIDGAHGPGMIPLDLHDMGCDAYASCCHKWMLASKGTGFLYVSKDFQQTLQTYFVGAGSDDAKWNMRTQPVQMGNYASSAHRYYGGSQNNGLYKGVDAAIDFLDGIGMQNVYTRVKTLGAYVQSSLASLGDKVELVTPTEDQSRCAINGFRIRGVEYDKFYAKAMDNKIRIRIVPENGLNLLRVSTHIYNNKEEIDRLTELIRTS